MGHFRSIDSGRQAHRELHAQQRGPRARFRRRASPSSPATFAFSNLPPSCPAVVTQFHAGAPPCMERLPPCCDRRERLRKGAECTPRCAMTGAARAISVARKADGNVTFVAGERCAVHRRLHLYRGHRYPWHPSPMHAAPPKDHSFMMF